MTSNPRSALVERSLQFAALAHDGQKRKEASLPYITHPFSVALILLSYDFDDVIVSAGLLHDVLEDTHVSEEDVKRQVGDDVLRIILALTEDKRLAWEERKAAYIACVASSDISVKAVSIADKIHNLQSLLAAYEKRGDEVWQMFSRGPQKQLAFMEGLLEVYANGWNHPLVAEYRLLVEHLRSKIQ